MPDILHRVGIDAAPAKVHEALTTLPGLCGWWTTVTTGDPGANGRIDFEFCEMQVLAAEPGKLVHWRCTRGPEEWLGTEVSFQLVWKEQRTFVLFKHAGWKSPVEFMHHCSTKWATFLLSLKELVETGAGRPLPHDLRIAVND